MTTSYQPTSDQPLVHQFIRRYGRRPTPEELAELHAGRAPTTTTVRTTLRHRLARLILKA